MTTERVQLGDQVQDTVTGFKGVAIMRAEWLHGCFRIGIQPDTLDKDGRPQEIQTFDEPQVKVLKRKKVDRITNTGGPRDSKIEAQRN